MAKKNKDYNRYQIEEIIGTISKAKDGTSNWGKYLMRCSYDESPATIDVRHMCFKDDGSKIIGKGISLTDTEADTLTDMLVSNGFGTSECLDKELQRRKKLYGLEGDD